MFFIIPVLILQEYDEVATLSAALGISKPRKHSLGSINTFKRASGGKRLASISSQVSSQQKPPAGSHQVVSCRKGTQ